MPSPFDPAAIAPETARFNRNLERMLAEGPLPFAVPLADLRRARAEGRGALPVGGPREGSDWLAFDAPSGRVQRLRVSRPEGTPAGTYLHIHGGGWTIGGPEQHDDANQRIARNTGAEVVSVQYRLCPENPWPAPRDDCLAAALHVLETRPGPLVIGGESAGAHLAAVTALALRTAGQGARLAGAVLNYGMFDLTGTPSVRRWGERYLVLSTPVIAWFVRNLAGEADPAAPEMSPLGADLTGLCPALLQCGTADPLLDDTLFMAARWEAAGNPVERVILPGGVHAFDRFDLAIARVALGRQDAFIAGCLAG